MPQIFSKSVMFEVWNVKHPARQWPASCINKICFYLDASQSFVEYWVACATFKQNLSFFKNKF